MQEAVNSVMLWLTKCQKTVEVCSHLFRQKRLDFKEVDDLRSDQGCPRYSSTQYVRWHVRKQWEELSTCSYWWLCVHTFTRFGRWSVPFMSTCVSTFTKLTSPNHSSQLCGGQSRSVDLLSKFMSAEALHKLSCDWNWQICHWTEAFVSCQ